MARGYTHVIISKPGTSRNPRIPVSMSTVSVLGQDEADIQTGNLQYKTF